MFTTENADVNPNGLGALLISGVNTFLANSKPIFINGPRRILRILLHYTIFEVYVFDNSVLAGDRLQKPYNVSQFFFLSVVICV